MTLVRQVGQAMAVVVATLTARGAGAQQPSGWEGGPVLAAIFSDPAFLGGGASVAWRPGGGTRVVVNLAAGSADGRLAGRGELLAQLLLSPGRTRGAGLYGLGGVAGQVGRSDRGSLVVGLGLEGSPAGPSGWFVEAGVGGGARMTVGWRWRRWTRNAPAP